MEASPGRHFPFDSPCAPGNKPTRTQGWARADTQRQSTFLLLRTDWRDTPRLISNSAGALRTWALPSPDAGQAAHELWLPDAKQVARGVRLPDAKQAAHGVRLHCAQEPSAWELAPSEP